MKGNDLSSLTGRFKAYFDFSCVCSKNNQSMIPTHSTYNLLGLFWWLLRADKMIEESIEQ